MNKFDILLPLFCFICLFSETKAQDTITNTSIVNGFGVSFTPLFSNLVNNDGANGSIGWSLGVNTRLVLSAKNNVFLLTEIGGLNNSFISKNLPNTTGIIDAQGNINFDKVTYYDAVNKNNYVYLSVVIGKSIFQFSKGFHFYGTLGVKGQYLYSSTALSKGFLVNGQNQEFEYSYKGADITQNYVFALTGSIGVYKNFSNKFSLMISPYFSYDLNPAKINDGALSERTRMFYNTGINFIFYYNY